MSISSKCGNYKMIQDDEWITVKYLGSNIWMSKTKPELVIKLFSKWMNISFIQN